MAIINGPSLSEVEALPTPPMPTPKPLPQTPSLYTFRTNRSGHNNHFDCLALAFVTKPELCPAAAVVLADAEAAPEAVPEAAPERFGSEEAGVIFAS